MTKYDAVPVLPLPPAPSPGLPLAPPARVDEAPDTEAQDAYRVAHDLLAARRPVEALAVVEPALSLEPTDRGLRSLRAWAFLVRAQLGRAEAELRALVDDDPGDVWARHALGRALERQSRLAEALAHLRLAHAMTGEPGHAADVRRVERRVEQREAAAS